MKRDALALVILALTLCPIQAQSSAPKLPTQPTSPTDPALEATENLIAHPLILRCLCADSHQGYDTHGKPLQPPKQAVDWTLAGFYLQSATRKDSEHIDLNGQRVAIRYNPGSKLFDRQLLKTSHIHIELAASTDDTTISSALAEIFSDGIDYRLQQSMPEAWKRYFKPSLKWPDDGLRDADIVVPSPQTADIVTPKPDKKKELTLPTEAEENHVTGSVFLKLVIAADGTAHRISIVQPLGYGLDIHAVEAMRQWHFTPGTKQGQPVSMVIVFEQKLTPPTRPPLEQP